ncbi:MAG: hypothetical protein KGJ93_03170 [Patescibacteria group bacterium]|nr:hypothetical protein [Patescibacteria group bacterium]
MFKTSRQLVMLMVISVILTGFSLASIITLTDPGSTSKTTFLFFYLSLFLFCLSLLTIAGLGVRQWLMPKLFVLDLSASLRQAFLLSLMVVVCFLLLAQGLLFWWVGLCLVLFFLSIEFFLNLKV